MWILLALALYTLYLGVQVRRTRLAEGEPKKELIKGRFAIRHHQIGSIFLALIVMGAIGGITVTYINSGKIVIGPHLFAGLAIVGLVATSAALVPFMQKHDLGSQRSCVVELGSAGAVWLASHNRGANCAKDCQSDDGQ
jgi:hypothetical protein